MSQQQILLNQVFTSGAVTPTEVSVQITSGDDDGEENLTSGNVFLNSSDLELAYDGFQQLVGLRFPSVGIPQGSTIQSAFIQFVVDESSADNTCNLTIEGEDADDSVAFVASSNNLSLRTRTTASVAWSPTQWVSAGDAGAAQKTTDIAAVIQEIVDRAGFTDTSSLTIFITTADAGTNRRTAEAYDGVPASAPTLTVTYV